MSERGRKVAGVVLAGGESRRFGSDEEDKAIAGLEGETFIERAVGTLRSVTGSVVVAVSSAEQERMLRRALDGADGVVFAHDSDGFEGPVAGVLGAAEASSSRWLFVCACDMPSVSEEAVSWTVEKRRPGCDAVVPHDGGPRPRPQPLHSLYRRESLLGMKDTETEVEVESMMGLTDELGEVRRVSVAHDAPDTDTVEASLRNVNTKEDLRRLREHRQHP